MLVPCMHIWSFYYDKVLAKDENHEEKSETSSWWIEFPGVAIWWSELVSGSSLTISLFQVMPAGSTPLVLSCQLEFQTCKVHLCSLFNRLCNGPEGSGQLLSVHTHTSELWYGRKQKLCWVRTFTLILKDWPWTKILKNVVCGKLLILWMQSCW